MNFRTRILYKHSGGPVEVGYQSGSCTDERSGIHTALVRAGKLARLIAEREDIVFQIEIEVPYMEEATP